MDRPSTRLLLPIILLVAAAVPALAQPTSVEISTDANAEGVRVLVTHAAEVSYTVSSEAGRIQIDYSDPVRFDRGIRDFEDAVLVRILADGPSRLVLETGPGFRGFETFELSNPPRLVLDLRGSSGGNPVELDKLEPSRGKAPGERVVVLDPGHGGVEDGAVGTGGLKEKSLTLDIARRLRSILESERGVTVVLTREEDRLVGLDERTAIANHNRADLFVSIHLNASPRTSAAGAETYYLSTEATDDEARTLAALENGWSDDEPEDPANADPLDLVLWDLAQNRYLEESSSLGERVQKELNRLTGVRNRGVRQAPFRVLMGATMPAILVECGFISNPNEEQKFRDDAYRDRVARAIGNAVVDFLDANVPATSGSDAVRGGLD